MKIIVCFLFSFVFSQLSLSIIGEDFDKPNGICFSKNENTQGARGSYKKDLERWNNKKHKKKTQHSKQQQST